MSATNNKISQAQPEIETLVAARKSNRPTAGQDISGFCFDHAFLEKCMDTAHTVVYIYDMETDEYYFPNSLLENYLGYRPGELNPLHSDRMQQLIHPADRKGFREFSGRVFRFDQDITLEHQFRMLTSEGTWRRFLSREIIYQQPTPDRAGLVLGKAVELSRFEKRKSGTLDDHETLSTLVDVLEFRIWNIDSAFRIVSMNHLFEKSYQDRFRHKPEIGMNIFTGLPPELATRAKNAALKAFTGEMVVLGFESSMDEFPVHVEVIAQPVHDAEGKVHSLLCFARDVTKQKETEKIIERQNKFLTSVINSTQSSIFVVDSNYRYLHFNDRHRKTMKKIYGVDIEVGFSPLILARESGDVEKTIRNMERALRGETFSVIEEYGLTSLDRSVYELSYSPIFDDNGNVTAVTFISNNITEKLQAREQLKEAEKKFSDIFEHSPDGIFLEDENGTILDVNEAAVILQGMPKKELIGKNIRDLIPPDRIDHALQMYRKLYQGEINLVESFVWNSRGLEIPVEITGTQVGDKNQSSFLLNVRDVSVRKMMEAERAIYLEEKSRQKEELIKASLQMQLDERNRISAEMHDELGAGLSKISILCEVIKKSAELPESVASNLEKILHSSRDVQDSISEIIWSMDPKHDTLENLVAYINHFASEFLESCPVTFHMELPEKIPSITLSGKFRRNIFLVVKETLNNTIKHADATEIFMQISIQEERMLINVRDNGKGFELSPVSRFKNGIKNMNHRMNDIGGSLMIESVQGGGTSTRIFVGLSAEKT